jgi:hypothetical protein
VLKELDKAVGSIKSSGLHKCIIFILLLLALVVFSFVSWFRNKGELVQASVAMSVAEVPVF